MEVFNKIADMVMAEHEGAVAFEYLIILVIMAVALFVAFKLLQTELVFKSFEISEFIRKNGQPNIAV